jgi:hypothetical protein
MYQRHKIILKIIKITQIQKNKVNNNKSLKVKYKKRTKNKLIKLKKMLLN